MGEAAAVSAFHAEVGIRVNGFDLGDLYALNSVIGSSNQQLLHHLWLEFRSLNASLW